MNCPHFGKELDCDTCPFHWDGCQFPHGKTPRGELFIFKPKVSSKDLYGEYTMGIIEGLEVKDD